MSINLSEGLKLDLTPVGLFSRYDNLVDILRKHAEYNTAKSWTERFGRWLVMPNSQRRSRLDELGVPGSGGEVTGDVVHTAIERELDISRRERGMVMPTLVVAQPVKVGKGRDADDPFNTPLDYLLAIPMGENKDALCDRLVAETSFVTHYGYTPYGRPDDISESEWDARSQEWATVFNSWTIESGLNITVVPSVRNKIDMLDDADLDAMIDEVNDSRATFCLRRLTDEIVAHLNAPATALDAIGNRMIVGEVFRDHLNQEEVISDDTVRLTKDDLYSGKKFPLLCHALPADRVAELVELTRERIAAERS